MASAMVEDSSFEEDQVASMSTDDVLRASRLLDNEIRILEEELQRTNLEVESFKEKTKENQEKIKLKKQLPYLFGNRVEILEMNPEDDAEEDGANIDLDSQRKGKCFVLKTSTHQSLKTLAPISRHFFIFMRGPIGECHYFHLEVKTHDNTWGPRNELCNAENVEMNFGGVHTYSLMPNSDYALHMVSRKCTCRNFRIHFSALEVAV